MNAALDSWETRKVEEIERKKKFQRNKYAGIGNWKVKLLWLSGDIKLSSTELEPANI